MTSALVTQHRCLSVCFSPSTSHPAPLRLVQSMEFSCIVFDTAPTGHTLRLLSFPSTLEKSLNKFMGLSNSFGPMIQQVRRT